MLLCSIECCFINIICCIGPSINWFGWWRINAISSASASCLKCWGYLLSHEHVCSFSVIPMWLIYSTWFWGKGVFSLHPTFLMPIYTQKVSPAVSITDYFTKQPAKSLFCNLAEQRNPELGPPAILSKHLCETIDSCNVFKRKSHKTYCGLLTVITTVVMLCQVYTDLM